MMRIAQSVKAFVEEVAFPAIMNGASLELRQYSEIVEGFGAALGVDAIPCERGGGGAVEPVNFAGNAHTGFVEVSQWGASQQVLDCGLERGKRLVELGFYGLDGGLADGLVKDVPGHLGDAFER